MPVIPLSIHKMRQNAETVGHWVFSALLDTATSLDDASGRAHPGTLGSGAAAPTWVNTGRHRRALSFDGGDTVVIPNHADLNPGAITVSYWANPAASAVYVLVGKQHTSAPRTGYDLNIVNLKVSFQLAVGGGVFADATGPTAMTAGTWNYIVGTYDGSNIKVYLNGVLDATTALSGTLASNALDLTLGDRPVGEVPSPYVGRLDDVQIKNVAMTAAEIAAEFQRMTRVLLIG